MNSETMKNAHLYLGLTRRELKRRLELGQIDPQILKAQLDQNSRELKLDALSERWIELKSLDQVDKFEPTE
ncbi:MAG: hypothetical protein H7256_13570 [Bdellovibrio sp.]|nr:hypothetical protein [Bdellovibrio sp.]